MSVLTITCVTDSDLRPAAGPSDQNRTVQGARQRIGPFWIDEPFWYWVAWAATLLVAVGLFLLAIWFDRP